jgi:lia operon protein LiaG
VPKLPILAALFLLSAAPLPGQDTVSYLLAGKDVAIYNLVGEVVVLGGSGSTVTVKVSRIGRDAGQLTVKTGELRGSQTLRVLYPSAEIVYRPLGRGSSTNFNVRDDGTWGDDQDSRRDRHEGQRVTIRGDGAGLEAAANLRITLPPGRRVGVYLGVGRLEVANVDGELLLSAASADVSARGTKGDLRIDTGSGEIRAEQLEGQVSLNTGSGDVAVNGHQRGTMKIDTGSGSVVGSSVVASELEIDTGSGDIRLEGIRVPRLNLETGSGSIRADLVGPVETVMVETGSGDVTLRLPDGTGATLDLDTGSGGFSLDVPVELLKRGEGSLKGRIGDGHGRIHIETGSGDIALVK